MIEEELKEKYHFGIVNAPCCGKCGWFERQYEDTYCRHPNFQDPYDPECPTPLIWPDEHNVCDLYTPKKEKTTND